MEDGVLTPCQHRYHSHCFFTWIHDHKTCPLCRKQLIRDVSHDEEMSLRELRQQINWESVVYETLITNTKAKEREIRKMNQKLQAINYNIMKQKETSIQIQENIIRKSRHLNYIIQRYNRFIYSLNQKHRRGLLL